MRPWPASPWRNRSDHRAHTRRRAGRRGDREGGATCAATSATGCSPGSPAPRGPAAATASTAPRGRGGSPRTRDPAGARRRVDVRRRHPGAAAAVAAPARDGRRDGPLRLRGRPVGAAAAHVVLPRGHDVRHRRGRREDGRRRPARARDGGRHRPRRSRRTPPPTRTCCAGCTSRRSTASWPRTSGTAREPLDQGGRDAYVAETARVAEALGVADPPRSEAELRAQLAAYRPELRGTPAARETARFLLLHPPLPVPARAPYAGLAAAAVG